MNRFRSFPQNWRNGCPVIWTAAFSPIPAAFAVEVALKIALQYFINRGEKKRTKILALEHAYHGDTFKAMEAGDDEDYHFILKACAPAVRLCIFRPAQRLWLPSGSLKRKII